MSHHSINLNLNLNLPANQKPLYRLIWFQIQVLCVTFYPTFSRLWLERNWIFYVRCWACMMDAGLSLRVFSPDPALLYAVAWSLEKGSALGGWGTWGGPALLHWWMAINNITSYWKHHLFCWSLLGSLLLPFSQCQATLSLIFTGGKQCCGRLLSHCTWRLPAAWDYSPTVLPHLPLKGGAFLLDLAGKSQLGGTAPLQIPCLHGGVMHSSLGLVAG